MNKFLKWIKEHVRPYIRLSGSKKVEVTGLEQDRTRHQDLQDKIEDVEKKVEAGIKISFKF